MDRRKEPRFVYGAWLQAVTDREGSPVFYRSIDVSRGGILLRAPTSGWSALGAGTANPETVMPKIGQLVNIRLVTENEHRVITVSGEVVHHTGDRFGVRFVNLDAVQRQFIEALLDELPDPDDERCTPESAHERGKRD